MLRWRLKEVMTEMQLDITEVARRSGVSRRTRATIYRNPSHIGKLSTLERVANGLDVPHGTLIEKIVQE